MVRLGRWRRFKLCYEAGEHFLLETISSLKNVREVKLQWSGFATSLMERLGYTLGMCVLEMNYRSHPNVVTPLSDLFYASMVESAKSASEFSCN